MFRKKIYGKSQETTCTFCGERAIMQTEEKLPCCKEHKNSTLEVMHCVCGNILALKHSKYGPFFTCEKCGVISFAKAMELKEGNNSNGGYKLNKKYRTSLERTRQNLRKQGQSMHTENTKGSNQGYEEKTTAGKTAKELWKEYYGV